MVTRRSYRSTLREEQAKATRVRIRNSARSLFEARGFGETTIAEIATAAGVSTQTVYAVFGGKAGIIGAMLEELEETVRMDVWVERILAEPDPRRQLQLFVAFNRDMFESGATILRAMVAGRGAADVAELIERGDGARREGTRRLAEKLAASGALRTGLGTREAADRIWLLTSAEQFLHATDTLGWGGEEYERWLGQLLEQEVLRPDA